MRSRRPFVFATILWTVHFLSLLTLGTCIVLFVQYQNKVAAQALLGALGLAAVTWLIAFLRRKTALCPMCKGSPLLSSGAEPHLKATKLPLLNHGISAILGILFIQKFTCMYCGSRYDLLKAYRGYHSNPDEEMLRPR